MKNNFFVILIHLSILLAVIFSFNEIIELNRIVDIQKETIKKVTTLNSKLTEENLSGRFCIKWDNTKDFDTMEELELFLKEDKTDEIAYQEKVFECEEFAQTLQNNAIQKGYRMSVQLMNKGEELHLANSAVVMGPKAAMVLIEPQTDYYEVVAYLD